MNKLDEIKAFIQASEAERAELADLTGNCLYAGSLVDDIIEQQQKLRQQAKRLQVISIQKPFFEEADFEVHMKFDAFKSFVDLTECEKHDFHSDYANGTCRRHRISIDNIIFYAIENLEEHKNAQAI